MQTLTVRLYVDDPDAASYFYLDLFRASIVHRFEYEGRADRIEMEIEGVPFTLIRYPGPKIPANCLEFQVAVEKDRLASLYADALERDAVAIEAPATCTEVWETTACFDDPFGFRWNLYHKDDEI
ncbi:Glyoxalase-like domain [Aedoeadaptatus ivorii]|uniref:Glyoxalase-like domain n=1 Tax=Aedoeadaptatus ivorii TaxID=54006 RepID=A0A3S4Z4P8_9FIRM|nr:VOC family protein [Peptoniphilus ivorii]VEJ36292.1 Glyoxalase-like domain [Peptoniphilus ivorii]